MHWYNFLLFHIFCSFDNSDYQRNGDYAPTRLSVQKDGINLVCLTKVRSNPENNVGLLTLAKYAHNIFYLTLIKSIFKINLLKF